MQFGYDFHFVDCNLNFDFDPFIEPYLFEYIKNELDDCFETSEACFVIVSYFLLYSSQFEKEMIINNDNFSLWLAIDTGEHRCH